MVMKNLTSINTVAIPKGENRELAEDWLTEKLGLNVPEKDSRCLHLCVDK